MKKAITAVLFLAGLFLMCCDNLCVVLIGLACMVPGVIVSNIQTKKTRPHAWRH